jgi:hypothetical protein
MVPRSPARCLADPRLLAQGSKQLREKRSSRRERSLCTANKLRITIIQPTCKPKRLEARVGISEHVPELIIVHALPDGTRRDIDDEPGTAEVIADDAIRYTTFDHVIGHVAFAGIDETSYYISGSIEFSHWVQLVLIQKALDQRANQRKLTNSTTSPYFPLPVVESPCKPERLEARVGVGNHLAEPSIVHALDNCTSDDIHHEAGTP